MADDDTATSSDDDTAAIGDASPGTPLNNQALDPANESGGRRPVPDTLDELYDTLGAVSAGMDVRDQEGDQLKKQVADQEKALLEQRQAALDADDDEAFEKVTSQLDELHEAWRVLTEPPDDEESDAPQPGTEASERDGDERDRAGVDPGGREREPVPGGGADSELQRRPGSGGAADGRD